MGSCTEREFYDINFVSRKSNLFYLLHLPRVRHHTMFIPHHIVVVRDVTVIKSI